VIWGNLKIYWKGILEGLEKFFKPFSSLYSNLKIKNILIINIPFPFSTKLPSQIRREISLFLSPPPPTAIPFPPLQTPKQSKKLKNSHDLLSCICYLSWFISSISTCISGCLQWVSWLHIYMWGMWDIKNLAWEQ